MEAQREIAVLFLKRKRHRNGRMAGNSEKRGEKKI